MQVLLSDIQDNCVIISMPRWQWGSNSFRLSLSGRYTAQSLLSILVADANSAKKAVVTFARHDMISHSIAIEWELLVPNFSIKPKSTSAMIFSFSAFDYNRWRLSRDDDWIVKEIMRKLLEFGIKRIESVVTESFLQIMQSRQRLLQQLAKIIKSVKLHVSLYFWTSEPDSGKS